MNALRPTTRSVGVLVALSGTAVLCVSGAVALLATRPKLTKLLGWESAPERTPADLRLGFDDVAYANGLRGWWILAPGSKGSVIIVHGFETSDNPRATDLGPGLDVAAALRLREISSLVINLGYATGRHPYSAGGLEVGDVLAAVDWVLGQTDGPIGIFGVSAGGHTAVAAGRRDHRIRVVVTDSAFVDGAEMIVVQASELLKLPKLFYALTPRLMRLLNGVSPIDLGTTRSATPPMLHIHGDADLAVHVSNVRRLSDVTGGEVWIVEGSDHVRSHQNSPTIYERRVAAFFDRHLTSTDRSRVQNRDDGLT